MKENDSYMESVWEVREKKEGKTYFSEQYVEVGVILSLSASRFVIVLLKLWRVTGSLA
jgi:hypothetical protein